MCILVYLCTCIYICTYIYMYIYVHIGLHNSYEYPKFRKLTLVCVAVYSV